MAFGRKTGGRTAGTPNKVTLKGREALVAVIDANAPRLQGWLDLIEQQEGPSAAWRAYVSLVEFAVPKMSRNELIADGAVNLAVSWMPVQAAEYQESDALVDVEANLISD